MRSEFELTPEQRAFAHEHHGLLMKFIGKYHLSDDYYGPLAERYLRTVKQYMEKPALQKICVLYNPVVPTSEGTQLRLEEGEALQPESFSG